MRRKFAGVVLGGTLLFGAACGGGTSKVDPVKAACATKSDALAAQNAGRTAKVGDLRRTLAGLDKAAKVAPADIRPDFKTAHDAIKPFIDLLIELKGDVRKAEADKRFSAATATLKAAQTADDRVNKFYTDCK